jgi:hypothetical protein
MVAMAPTAMVGVMLMFHLHQDTVIVQVVVDMEHPQEQGRIVGHQHLILVEAANGALGEAQVGYILLEEMEE